MSEPLVAPVWRDAVLRGEQFPLYAVSDNGGVRNNATGAVLKPYRSGTRGYLVVALRRAGLTIRCYVHHLVAETFIGPQPLGHDVCHADGLIENNSFPNLRYGTRSENLADRARHGTAQIGDRNPAAILTNEEAEQIRLRRRGGEPLWLLSIEFGVAQSTISRIANGVRRPA